jgi:hypothetical protein
VNVNVAMIFGNNMGSFLNQSIIRSLFLLLTHTLLPVSFFMTSP